jgi:hypothetical protein
MNEQFKTLDKYGGITIGQELTIVKSGENVGRFIKMNERIKQLAEQAGFVDKGSNHTAYINFDHEKFAQLIIEECCNQLHDPNRYSDGDFAKWRIHKHFGLDYEPIHQ